MNEQEILIPNIVLNRKRAQSRLSALKTVLGNIIKLI